LLEGVEEAEGVGVEVGEEMGRPPLVAAGVVVVLMMMMMWWLMMMEKG